MSSTDSFRFVVGIDMDGVLCDYEGFLRQVTAESLGIDPADIPTSNTWGFSNWPFDNIAHYQAMHLKAVAEHDMFANLDQIDGASDTLWKLNDTHDELRFRIVTHRYMSFQTEELKQKAGKRINAKVTTDTVNWLQQPRPDGLPLIPFHDLAILGTTKADKASVGCDLYIDDSPGNIQALRASGNDAIIFTQEYNKDLPGARANNWAQVAALIEAKLAEQKAFRAL